MEWEGAPVKKLWNLKGATLFTNEKMSEYRLRFCAAKDDDEVYRAISFTRSLCMFTFIYFFKLLLEINEISHVACNCVDVIGFVCL